MHRDPIEIGEGTARRRKVEVAERHLEALQHLPRLGWKQSRLGLSRDTRAGPTQGVDRAEDDGGPRFECDQERGEVLATFATSALEGLGCRTKIVGAEIA